jgi:hypothetical protein
MKKILMVATAALCFAGSSFAQENAGGDSASSSAFGDMNKEKIVAGAVAVGVLGAMVANNRGNAKIEPGPGPGPGPGPDPECGAGEELVDGECVPSAPTTTVTTTVTATNTVTSTMTTPVTVTASTTAL